jgi:hypothetical protein
MSASEKLKALDAWFKDEANYGAPWAEASSELVVALPQIVAVVEAAELARDFMQATFPDEVGKPAAVGITSDALTALEEALS